MSALHMVFSEAGLDAARVRMASGDALLLIADGTYAARSIENVGRAPLYALEEDITLRGIQPDDAVELVNYAGMVALTERHQPVVSWRE